MEYNFPIRELRKVVLDACDELFTNEHMAEIVYEHIIDAVEDYLYECRKEED